MSAQHNSGRKGWRLARLGEVCEKITDGTHHSPVNGSKGTFKYITAKNIRPWGLDLSDITYIDAATHAEIFSRCDVRIDDVLMVKDGATTGRLALNTLDEPFSLLSSVGVLRPGPELLPKYLLYVLQSPSVKDRLLAQVAGVAITRLTLKKLKESCIPVAPLSEQHRIVAEIEEQLSRLEAGVAALKRVQANLKRYRASVLSAAILGELDGSGGTDGWTQSEIQALAAKEPNSITDGPFGSKLKTAHYTSTGPRVIRLQNIGDGVFVDEKAHISEDHFASLSKHRVFPGDLVIAGLGETLPRACLIPDDIGPAIVKADCIRFKAGGSVLPKYLKYALNADKTRRATKERMHGVGRPRLNLGEIKSIIVPVPPLARQREIVEEVDRRLSVVEELETQVRADLARADRLRQAILSSAFSSHSEH